MFCRYCGTQLEEGARFCTECGKVIDENITDCTTGATTIQNNNYPIAKKDGSGKLKLRTIIDVVALVVLLTAVIVIWSVLEDGSSTWEEKCQLVTSAIAMYQAGNNGDTPKSGRDLNAYLNNGFNSLQDTPAGATYYIDSEKFVSEYPYYIGNNETYKHGVVDYGGISGGRYVYYFK